MKRCIVVFALPGRQWLWRVELPEQGTVSDALLKARTQSAEPDVPWDLADVGIFGEPCDRAAVPRDGDRIEIYRPLMADPKASRRARAAAGRAAADRVSARPRAPSRKASR